MEKIGVKKGWSLREFRALKGKMRVGEFSDKETGELFKSCIFGETKDTYTFVSFSSNLGVLTPAEIKEQADELRVVELESGNYSLCRNNSNWEEVDI